MRPSSSTASADSTVPDTSTIVPSVLRPASQSSTANAIVSAPPTTVRRATRAAFEGRGSSLVVTARYWVAVRGSGWSWTRPPNLRTRRA